MALTDYARNLMMDAAFRDQAITFPSSFWVALFTVSPTASSGGTELAVSGYARVEVESSLLSWSGTQGAGTTGASSGSSGEMSNNDVVQFEDSATVAWSGIVAVGLFDASSGGNLWHFGPIVDSNGDPTTRSFSIGDVVEFTEGTLVLSWE